MKISPTYILNHLPYTLSSGWTIVKVLEAHKEQYPSVIALCPVCKQRKKLLFNSILYKPSFQCKQCRSKELALKQKHERKRSKKQLTLKLDEDFLEAFRTKAVQENKNPTLLIRKWIQDYVNS